MARDTSETPADAFFHYRKFILYQEEIRFLVLRSLSADIAFQSTTTYADVTLSVS